MIQEYFIHNNISENGIIIFAGVDEFNKEIFDRLKGMFPDENIVFQNNFLY